MIIVAGGDSFVWGSELSDSPHGGPDGYSRQTFPALLATEYHCAAYPGLGNIVIAQRVREYCNRIQPDLVLVCWTWPSRDNRTHSDYELEALQDWLEDRDIPFLFTCADNCVITGKLDYTNWYLFPAGIGANQTESPRGFYQWARENKYPCGPQGHPLEQAHIDAAQLIQEKLNEMD